MIDTLYVNGCSWTEGHLLHNDPPARIYAESIGYSFPNPKDLFFANKNGIGPEYPFRDIYDKFNFAGVIAKQLNINTVHNDAIGAGSNARIIRTTVDYVKNLTKEQCSNTLIIIGWTDPSRNELYLNDNKEQQYWAKFNLTQPFRYLNGDFDPEFTANIDKFQEMYTVYVHSYYANIVKFFEQSYLLANLLENKGIRYYFFNTFPVFWGLREPEYTNTITQFNREIEIYHTLNTHSIHDTFVHYIGHKPEWTLPDDIHHPNILGHYLWAEQLLHSIQTRGII